MFFVLFALLPICHCYSWKMHRYLGNTLAQNMDPQLYDTVTSYTGPLANASIWADQVKNNRKYTWSKSLHYININNTCENPKIISCERCIYTGILNMTNAIKYNGPTPDARPFSTNALIWTL